MLINLLAKSHISFFDKTCLRRIAKESISRICIYSNVKIYKKTKVATCAIDVLAPMSGRRVHVDCYRVYFARSRLLYLSLSHDENARVYILRLTFSVTYLYILLRLLHVCITRKRSYLRCAFFLLLGFPFPLSFSLFLSVYSCL